MTDHMQSLSSAESILLVDWPNPGVPRALAAAGLAVFAYSPGRFSTATVVPEPHGDDDPRCIYLPREGESGYLVFRPLDGWPDHVDLVCVYRPIQELAGIIADLVLPLGAGLIWLQPPMSIDANHEAARLAAEHGLQLVQGTDIAQSAGAVNQTRG
jgi:hypothetical protein